MKICIVGENLNPPWVEGVRNIGYELAKSLCEIGNEVHILTRGAGEHEQEPIDGITFHRVRGSIFVKGPEVLESLRDIDIVHFHHFHIHKAFLLWAMRQELRKLKSVGYVCLPSFLSLRNWLSRFTNHPIEAFTRVGCISHPGMVRKQIAMVDETIVSSNCIAEILRNVDGHDLEVIPPPIDVQKFAEARKRREAVRASMGLKDDQPLLLYVGNHRWVRGEDHFLKAFSKVRKKLPNARAVLVTPFPITGPMRRLINELSLEQYLTFFSRDVPTDIPALYAASSAYVFTGVSLEAGFAASVDPPLSVLESLSAGTPVVSYDVGGIGDIARQVGGIITVPALNNDLLATSIIETLQNQYFRLPSIEQLRASFDSAVQAKRFLDVYRRVLGD